MPPFASHLNFLDPQKTEDGKPYGPLRFGELTKECYLISKNLNTSYVDVLKITPVERRYLINFLIQDAKRTQDIIEKNKAESKFKK